MSQVSSDAKCPFNPKVLYLLGAGLTWLVVFKALKIRNKRRRPFDLELSTRKWLKIQKEESLAHMIDTQNNKEIFRIKVLTYNVLAYEYSHGKEHLGKYKGTEKEFVEDFEYRASRVVREI
jgi:mRNA deadenylase 3'-5' endonuclease subunit Ccr4